MIPLCVKGAELSLPQALPGRNHVAFGSSQEIRFGKTHKGASNVAYLPTFDV